MEFGRGFKLIIWPAIFVRTGDFWTSLSPTPAVLNRGSSSAASGSDHIYALRGGGANEFWRYSISGNSWSNRTTFSGNVSTSAMVPVGTDHIYVIWRNAGDEFVRSIMRHNITANTWTSLASTPAVIGNGATLAWSGGDHIFATRGGGSSEFWQYSISGNSWSTRASVPEIVWARACVWAGGDFLFLLAGGGFYRYSISGNTWATMANLPTSRGQEASLIFVAGDFIFASIGTNNEFWRYSISGNSWTRFANAPAVTTIDGSLAYAGGRHIYALRGETFSDFWAYTLP